MLTTPRKIHQFVNKLCSRIIKDSEPIFVDVIVDRGAQMNECFFNVRNKIKRAEGDIQHGWTIWENPGLFVEAEFHAVWVSPSGKLIDVSPKRDGEKTDTLSP